jgi:hypothetical protein
MIRIGKLGSEALMHKINMFHRTGVTTVGFENSGWLEHTKNT